MIVEVNVQDDKWNNFFREPELCVQEIAEFFLKDLNVKKSQSVLSIVLAGDTLLLDLNYTYRNINRPTNVLSFNYESESYNIYQGEIFISIDRIVSEADEMRIDILTHLHHMLVHGILHLLGYDHNTPEETKEMQTLEIALLRKRNIENPYEK